MFVSTFTILGALLLRVALGQWTRSSEITKTHANFDFTISVPSLFDHPASQVEDGKILFNVTGQQAVFSVDDKGRITDATGLKCYVPIDDGPLSCSNDTLWLQGLTISTSNTLLCGGSPLFHLCRQENDTTYGIYLNPKGINGSQCIITTIQTNRLNVSHQDYSPSGSSESFASSIWQTYTVGRK
ncbi:hypothetical protein M434DRAFT_37881 [Hypoxylon sp. CO27-5]|nr:hypothetical protein M434DRAFT_37881 [Hypoxylon sp. CO27-5]